MAVEKGAYNIFLAAIFFLNWVATCVSFSTSLFQAGHADFTGTPRPPFQGGLNMLTYFYWWGYNNNIYNNVAWINEYTVIPFPAAAHAKCWNVQGWFLTVMIFAFIGTLASLVMVFLRAVGRNILLPFVKHRQHAVQLEIYLCIFNMVFIFAGLIINLAGCMIWEYFQELTYSVVYPTNILFIWIVWGSMFWAFKALRQIKEDEPQTGRPAPAVSVAKPEPATVYTPYMPSGPGPKSNVPYSSTNPNYQPAEPERVNALPLPPRPGNQPAASGRNELPLPPRPAERRNSDGGEGRNELPLPPRPGTKKPKEDKKGPAPPPAKKGGPKPPPGRRG